MSMLLIILGLHLEIIKMLSASETNAEIPSHATAAFHAKNFRPYLSFSPRNIT